MKYLHILTVSTVAAFFSVQTVTSYADNLFVSNFGNATIEQFASNGSASVFAADPGTGQVLLNPTGLAFDQGGNLYVANVSSTIEKFSASGTASRFTSSGVSNPGAIAFDGSGNLFVANAGNNTIEKFTPTAVGSVFASFSTGISGPVGLAFDGGGNLYVANSHSNAIERFTPNGVGSIFANGLNSPTGLAFDHLGNLYVATAQNDIEKFTPAGAESLFASTAPYQAEGIAFDSSGNLYASLFASNAVEEFSSSGSVVNTFTTGLNGPAFIAVQSPEPASVLLFWIGALVITTGRPNRGHNNHVHIPNK